MKMLSGLIGSLILLLLNGYSIAAVNSPLRALSFKTVSLASSNHDGFTPSLTSMDSNIMFALGSPQIWYALDSSRCWVDIVMQKNSASTLFTTIEISYQIDQKSAQGTQTKKGSLLYWTFFSKWTFTFNCDRTKNTTIQLIKASDAKISSILYRATVGCIGNCYVEDDGRAISSSGAAITNESTGGRTSVKGESDGGVQGVGESSIFEVTNIFFGDSSADSTQSSTADDIIPDDGHETSSTSVDGNNDETSSISTIPEERISSTGTTADGGDDEDSSSTGTIPDDDNYESSSTGSIPDDDEDSSSTGSVPDDDEDSSSTGSVPDDGEDSSSTGSVPDDGEDSSSTGSIPDDGEDSSSTGSVPDDGEDSSSTGSIPDDGEDSSSTGSIPDDGEDSSSTGSIPDDDEDSSSTGSVPDDGEDSSSTGSIPDDGEDSSSTGTIPNDGESSTSDVIRGSTGDSTSPSFPDASGVFDTSSITHEWESSTGSDEDDPNLSLSLMWDLVNSLLETMRRLRNRLREHCDNHTWCKTVDVN